MSQSRVIVFQKVRCSLISCLIILIQFQPTPSSTVESFPEKREICQPYAMFLICETNIVEVLLQNITEAPKGEISISEVRLALITLFLMMKLLTLNDVADY
jgi:hypothetical protein